MPAVESILHTASIAENDIVSRRTARVVRERKGGANGRIDIDVGNANADAESRHLEKQNQMRET